MTTSHNERAQDVGVALPERAVAACVAEAQAVARQTERDRAVAEERQLATARDWLKGLGRDGDVTPVAVWTDAERSYPDVRMEIDGLEFLLQCRQADHSKFAIDRLYLVRPCARCQEPVFEQLPEWWVPVVLAQIGAVLRLGSLHIPDCRQADVEAAIEQAATIEIPKANAGELLARRLVASASTDDLWTRVCRHEHDRAHSRVDAVLKREAATTIRELNGQVEQARTPAEMLLEGVRRMIVEEVLL